MNEYPATTHAGAGGGGRRHAPEAQRQSLGARRSAHASLEPSGSESDDSNWSYPPYTLTDLWCGAASEASEGGAGRDCARWGARRWSARAPHASCPLHFTFTPHALLNGSKWDHLSQDIWDKFIVSQQTEETFNNKIYLWRHLYLSIKALFPRYGLYVVGSTMSGFALESSDLDLCLYVRPPPQLAAAPRAHALLHLGFLLDFMRATESGALSDADLIQAKVPILKLRDARHGIRVDLNCNNLVGVRNTNLLQSYSQLDWRVRPLVLVVKLWAQANNINDARRRTLSSYSLTLMVLHYLQCGTSPPTLPCLPLASRAGSRCAPPPPYAPPPAPPAPRRPRLPHGLAELLLGFLHYYARFQYDKMAVSVRVGRCIPVSECRVARSHKNDPHQWKLMCVEEPFDLTNTARSVYDQDAFDKILDALRRSADALARGQRLRDVMPLQAVPRRR